MNFTTKTKQVIWL